MNKWEDIQRIKDEDLREWEEEYYLNELERHIKKIDGCFSEICDATERFEMTLFQDVFEKFARHTKGRICITINGKRFFAYGDIIIKEE